jgi:hypothetical protein
LEILQVKKAVHRFLRQAHLFGCFVEFSFREQNSIVAMMRRRIVTRERVIPRKMLMRFRVIVFFHDIKHSRSPVRFRQRIVQRKSFFRRVASLL